MADVDLDQLANEVAAQHNQSSEGIQSKADRALKNAPIYPIDKPKNKEGAFTRLVHGAGLPVNIKEMEQTGDSLAPWSKKGGFNPWALAGPIGPMLHGLVTQGIPYAAQRSGEQFEKAGHAIDQNRYGGALGHAAAGLLPVVGPNIADHNYAGAIGNILPFLAPKIGDVAGKVVPDQFKFDLINRAVGEGSIEPKFGKDFGRGLSRAKQGALTRGSSAQPSAGITSESGLPRATSAALDEASVVKQKLLQHPAAKIPSIPISDVIKENFGDITRNPITGTPGVETKAATNVPDTTTAQFNSFGNKLLEELTNRADPATGKLSPADIEQMRSERIIDPNYGKFSTDAPEASLNQKATKVSSDLIKRAEDALRLPSGQSALELLNSHIGDLMQGKRILPEKLAASRTAAPSILDKFNPKTIVRKAVAEAVEGRRDPGFNTGRFMMPVRTGLASLLSEKPWWLKDPTSGLDKIQPPSGFDSLPDAPELSTEEATSKFEDLIRRKQLSTPEAAIAREKLPVEEFVKQRFPNAKLTPDATPEWVSETLSKAAPGKPGLSVEEAPSELKTEGIDRHIVYRDPEGKPVAVASIVDGKGGEVMIRDFAADKSQGLLALKAAGLVGQKIAELGVKTHWAQISEDAARLVQRYEAREARRGIAAESPNASPNASRASLPPDLGQTGTQIPPQTSGPPGASGMAEAAAGPQNDDFHWMSKMHLNDLPDEHLQEASKANGSMAQLGFPPAPDHITKGDQVSGFDANNNLVSGSLEKLYPTLEDGKPVWKALVLDIKNGRTVELLADHVFNKLKGPPGNQKIDGVVKAEGSDYKEPPKLDQHLPRGTNRIVDKPPGAKEDASVGTGSMAQMGSAMAKGMQEGYIDSAWNRAKEGKKQLFSERPGSLEEYIQKTIDSGNVKSREDIATLVKNFYNKVK